MNNILVIHQRWYSIIFKNNEIPIRYTYVSEGILASTKLSNSIELLTYSESIAIVRQFTIKDILENWLVVRQLQYITFRGKFSSYRLR